MISIQHLMEFRNFTKPTVLSIYRLQFTPMINCQICVGYSST